MKKVLSESTKLRKHSRRRRGGVILLPFNVNVATPEEGSTPNNVIINWTNPDPHGTANEVWKSADGTTYTLFNTVAGNITQLIDTTGMASGDTWYYKVRLIDGSIPSDFSSVVSVSFSDLVKLPVSGLIHKIESLDFDGAANTSNALPWLDSSGFGHHWSAIIVNSPRVDQVVKANGHATVKFDPTTLFLPVYINGAWTFGSSGFAGLEVMCVYRQLANPPVNSGANGPGGAMFTFNNSVNASHQPYTNGLWLENFGRDSVLQFGPAVTDTAAAFCCYNVASAADGSAYDIWLNSEHLYSATTGGYTFAQQGTDAVGNPQQGYMIGAGSYAGPTYFCFKGNIAAVVVWNRRLTPGERIAARVYFSTIYGVTF